MAIYKKVKEPTLKQKETVKPQLKKEVKVTAAPSVVAEPVKKVSTVKPISPKVSVTPVAAPKDIKVQEKITNEPKKAVIEKVVPVTKEENLKKLSKTSIVTNFVKECKGCWNHQAWLEFCASIEKNGYTPIDFDQVGVLLETEKAAYFAACK